MSDAPLFEPTRDAGLDRLAAFVPAAGRDYAAKRNHDLPGHPHVSALSPYVRHRMVTEREVLEATLERHSPSAAEKFVQEVYWRTYWKGWLELRPSVWTLYRTGLNAARNRVQTESGLRREWEEACAGETGIDAFDHWAKQLVAENYLHNHARMWFASIWIFTLRLPWELGADFFLRHLLDGDPASNTLGWRWVAGLQTRGKTYLARPDNIAKYTGGRFRPEGLAPGAAALDGPPNPPRQEAPLSESFDRSAATGLLITEEDLSPGWMADLGVAPQATALRNTTHARSPWQVAPDVIHFTDAAMQDTAARHADWFGPTETVTDLVAWAKSQKITQIVTSYPPVGPAAEALLADQSPLEAEGIRVVRLIRPFDAEAWPYATAGFFKFKEKIPTLLGSLRGLRAA